jgi:hypothetical protein
MRIGTGVCAIERRAPPARACALFEEGATRMATTRPVSDSTASRQGAGDYVPGTGWILFAGVMIVMAGIFNVIYGIAAISNSKFFAANREFIISNLNTWGWVMLVVGVAQVLAALSIWNGRPFGRWFGIAAASVNAIATLVSIQAYPFWSLAVFSLDLLVVYGLATYGGNPKTAL